MDIIRRLSIVAYFAFALFTSALANGNQDLGTAAKVKTIEKYCKTLDSYGDKHREARRIFGLVEHYAPPDSSEEQRIISSNWREFKDEAAWENSGSDNQNEAAAVWTISGKATIAYFTYQSESGDWVIYASYYFDSTGNVAKIRSILNTFEGNITAIRDCYYQDGKVISEKKSLLDLTTQKPKKASAEFYDIETKVYLRESDLPFSNLLK